MERITTDISLKGEVWDEVLANLQPVIFKTYYGVYALCIAIGIMYDKQLENENSEVEHSVPRTMLYQKKTELELLFQTAILTTSTVDFDENKRLELAFGHTINDFNEMQFLTKFANFGVTILKDIISDEPLETMEAMKNFITSTFEGTNFDINPLSEDEIDIDVSDLDLG